MHDLLPKHSVLIHSLKSLEKVAGEISGSESQVKLTSLFSCAEPITIEFDAGATVQRCQVKSGT